MLRSLLRAIVRGTNNVPVITPLRPCIRGTIGSLRIGTPGLRVLPPRDCLRFKFLVGRTQNVIASSKGVTRRTAFLSIPYVALGACTRRPRA